MLTARARALRLLALLLVGAGAFVLLAPTPPGRIEPLDPVPAACGQGRLARNGDHVVLSLAGTPEEMGVQYGTLLGNTIRMAVREYVRPALEGDARARLLAAAKTARAAWPPEFLRELDACASAADVDADELLLAQCAGDIQAAAGRGTPDAAAHACSSFAAFGPATRDGRLICGRNLDYGLPEAMLRHAPLVVYYAPKEGHAFAAVGFAGILGGVTVVNDAGLVAANHLGGGGEARVDGVPALILLRLIAQRAATVEQGIELARRSPRMRGQILWLAQDAATDHPARAVALEYDAQNLAVREAENGILVVTNTNRALFRSVADAEVRCGRYRRLRELLDARRGRLDGAESLTTDARVANESTLQVTDIVAAPRIFRVRHGGSGAYRAKSVDYPFPKR